MVLFVIEATFVFAGILEPVIAIPTLITVVSSIVTVSSLLVVSQVASLMPPVKSQSTNKFHSPSAVFSCASS